MRPFTVSSLLVLLAIVIFVLAAFNVGAGWPVGLVPLGLAVFAASQLVP